MLKDFEPRLYQETIFATAVNYNTLAVLPTGMGKTAIAMLLAAHRLTQYPDLKILVLAPTKPLVEQIMQVFRRHFELPEEDIVMFTGFVRAEKRQEMFSKAKIIISTPQGMENDVIAGRIPLDDISLLVFDEGHRAVGDYAYVFLAKQYTKKARFGKILALTASPGSDNEKIQEVMKNLFIEKIELRTDSDPDVKPYIQDVDINWVSVELGEEFSSVRKFILDCFRDKLKELKNAGFVNGAQAQGMTRTEMLKLQGFLQAQIAQGNRDYESMKALSKIAEAMKIQHALELIETQGVSATFSYLKKLEEEGKKSKVKAVQNLVRDLNFRSALIKTRALHEKGAEHPKLGKLREIVDKEIAAKKNIKIIIFNQFRDSASRIVEEMNSIEECTAKLFVGQVKKNGSGMSQKDQIRMVEDFRNGAFNVLVSTAVGEEGLDIPQVDLVIFYEPIPSAIRTIQRRGRTGRTEKGRIITLVAKGTRDESYRWAAFHKEKRMYRNLAALRNDVSLNGNGREQRTLESYDSKFDVKIYADDREKGSGVIKELVNLEVKLDLKRLEVADYILSKRVGVEFKTVPDFVDSLIDGRLLTQIRELKEYFMRPLVIVEGNEDIYSVRKVHPHAIQGMLSTITVSYGIPILYTRTQRETALLLSIIAKREQDEIGRDFNPHFEKKTATLREQQEYIVSSLPGIGPSLARPLLERFGSVKGIVNASAEELRQVEKIGEKKAAAIREVLDKGY